MDTPPQRLTQPDAGAELKAAVNARHELGSDLEDHVLEAFLARVEQRIDAHVDQRLSNRSQAVPRTTNPGSIGVEKIAAPLALAIPLVAIAGDIAGAIGVLAVMAAVTIIIALVFVDRWRMS